MNYLIEGVKKVFHPKNESVFYYNENMLQNGIVIEEENIIYSAEDNELEDIKVETNIKVYVLYKISDNQECGTFQVYNGELLSPIEVFQILKNIFMLYENTTLSGFVNDVLDELYVSSSVSENQKFEFRRAMINNTKELLTLVEELDKAN